MKKILCFIITLISLNAFAQNRALPNTTLRTLEGKPINLNQAVTKGKVTLISFWATWCIPCKQEIKAITSKLEKWQKETDFNYATISVDDARATANVRAYAKTQGWKFPTYCDVNWDTKRSLNYSNVPFAIIVDQNGKIVKMHVGYTEGGEEELYKFVKELSAKK